MTIEKALRIEGWMYEPELRWLAQQASKHNVIVEIGSFLGRSTRAIGDNTNGVVFAIDNWYGPLDSNYIATKEERAQLFDVFQKNMDGLQGKVNVVQCDHDNVPDIGVRPDMVFIDGSHTLKDVRRDIKTWLRRAAPGALICGHDYFEPGVYQAVHELCPSATWAGPGTLIWQYEKPAEPFWDLRPESERGI